MQVGIDHTIVIRLELDPHEQYEATLNEPWRARPVRFTVERVRAEYPVTSYRSPIKLWGHAVKKDGAASVVTHSSYERWGDTSLPLEIQRAIWRAAIRADRLVDLSLSASEDEEN